MKTAIGGVGQLVVPKALLDALGLEAGADVDITMYGDGLHVAPHGRTARLVEQDGVLVASGVTAVDEDDVFALVDAGRR